MANVLKVALPGYDVENDTDPRHFSLVSDQDNILIKEKTRGTVSIANLATTNIPHGLSYIPFVLVYAEVSSGKWSQVVGQSGDYNTDITIDTTNISIFNGLGATKNFKYYIFYDQQI